MNPTHHIPDAMLAADVAGKMAYPFSVVIACHISMCDECRARYETHLAVGGVVLEDLPEVSVSADLQDRIMAALNAPVVEEPDLQRNGIYPAPLAGVLPAQGPKWRSVGMGTKQSILWSRPEGSLRLLHIPAGQAVPDHGHGGLEFTLVLQGSFGDSGGTFGTGDLEIADQEVEHIPVAGPECDCICLAATDAPLRFRGWVPRLLQPILRI